MIQKKKCCGTSRKFNENHVPPSLLDMSKFIEHIYLDDPLKIE